VVLFYTLGVFVLSAPSQWVTTVPVGPDSITTVPLLNTWTLWWNSDRCRHGFADYWHAPIFAPEPSAFAFSDPQPASLIVAPVLWFSGSRILAYNTYLWLSLTLNGLTGTWLLRLLRSPWWFSVLGGIAVLFLPIVHDQIEVVQLVPVWSVLWSWSALRRWGERPTVWRGIDVGLAVGITFMLSLHQGLILLLSLAGPVFILVRLRGWPTGNMLGSTGIGLALATAMVLPLALPIRRAMLTHDFRRPPAVVETLSARPGDYLVVPSRSLVRPQLLFAKETQPMQLSPGWLKLVLAAIGFGVLVSRHRHRRWSLFLATTAALAFLLSLGPNLQIGSWQPWWTLAEWCPGVAQIRSVYRFAYLAQLAVVLLAFQGLSVLWRMTGLRKVGHYKMILRGLLLLAGLLAALESLPSQPTLADVPSPETHREWIELVRDHTPPGRAAACFPFAVGGAPRDYQVTTDWMYFGTFHGVRLVNGYSGFFPRSNNILRSTLVEGFPAAPTLELLRAANVEFLVIDESSADVSVLPDAIGIASDLELVLRTSSGIAVYRLAPLQ